MGRAKREPGTIHHTSAVLDGGHDATAPYAPPFRICQLLRCMRKANLDCTHATNQPDGQIT